MSGEEKVFGTRNIKQIAPNLEEMNAVIFGLIRKFQEISDGAYLSGAYAEWHFKGLTYHAERMINEYTGIVDELKIRLEAAPDGEIFIMHTPQINHFMFEFYAFINLARITLDNLTHILRSKATS